VRPLFLRDERTDLERFGVLNIDDGAVDGIVLAIGHRALHGSLIGRFSVFILLIRVEGTGDRETTNQQLCGDGETGSAIHTFPLRFGRRICRIRYEWGQDHGKAYFQSSSASSSSSTYSSSSSSSSSSADSISSGSVPTTFKSAPHSSQLKESPS